MRINRFVVIVLAFLALIAGNVSAQQKLEPFAQGMFFENRKACEMAYLDGTARGYMPAPEHLKKPLKEAKGLLTAWCVQEDARKETTIKNPWMVLLAGTPAVIGADGKPVKDGRCRNNIHDAVMLPLPQGPRGPVGPQGPQGVPGPVGPTSVVTIPAPVVIPAPVTAPTTTPVYRPAKPVSSSGGPIVTVGLGYRFGSMHTDYTYPDSKRGDVPQQHNFASPVLTARIDQAADHGVFGEVSSTILGKTSAMQFQDITGASVTKKRDSDTSKDNSLELKGGYKFGLGSANVGVSVNYDRLCLCEQYAAQNTDTVTERSFQTFGLGVEASGSTASDEHKVTVRVSGTLGLSGHREKFTTQTYHGPPAITFPKVTDDTERAKLNRFGGEVDMQVAGPVHVFANVQYSAWASTRPTNHTAHEATSSLGTTVGIRVGFGK